jgi:hypothetical protein
MRQPTRLQLVEEGQHWLTKYVRAAECAEASRNATQYLIQLAFIAGMARVLNTLKDRDPVSAAAFRELMAACPSDEWSRPLVALMIWPTLDNDGLISRTIADQMERGTIRELAEVSAPMYVKFAFDTREKFNLWTE